ncbi:hypothetical protein BDN70DRAFT_936975 [Pholiota conissans]|uniref:Transmembrane protein n=1 Tax=Pholiota conissans TaxID=109636 RepID=A0A9P5YSY7_9AGAR|nr:hypothetical protein BDN70DRAFT_936975 [Pholiota conissans]
MASKQLRVILDDNAGNIVYGGGQWTLSTLVQWYQGTSNYPAFAQVGDGFGSMSMSFQGTSIAFIGNTPPQGLSQSGTVSIDGGAVTAFSYGSTKPPAYIQWYQSPTLSDANHTITVDRLDGTALDMVLITVGPNTPLAGNKVFIDNNDPALQYSGSWAESTDGFNAGSLPDGVPIGGSTQRTTTVGDAMTFQFTGTSVSVYGIFSWANIGSISVTYTLDGVDAAQSYPVTSSSPQHVSGDGEASNFLFYSNDNLSSSAHTLILKITDIENQIFALDYVVYSPSFSSFATMPNLTSVSTTTTSTFPNSGSVTTPTFSGITTTTTQASSSQTANMNTKSSPIGAIIGGVVGGLVVLVFGVFIFFCVRRRQSKGGVHLHPSVEQRQVPNTETTLPPQMTAFSPGRPSFGHSATSTDATPFPATTTSMPGFASISDLKRDRFENDNLRQGMSPFSIDTRSHTTSLDNSQPTDALEYMGSDSVPPAYDAISTNRSSLSPVRRATGDR